MYAIYGNIYHQYTPNVSIYTIHGSYGYSYPMVFSNTIFPPAESAMEPALEAVYDNGQVQGPGVRSQDEQRQLYQIRHDHLNIIWFIIYTYIILYIYTYPGWNFPHNLRGVDPLINGLCRGIL